MTDQAMMCRDGFVYGCGSTKHGQLPYLKFSSLEGPAEGVSRDDNDQPRNEVTQASRLKLPILQVSHQLLSITLVEPVLM